MTPLSRTGGSLGSEDADKACSGNWMASGCHKVRLDISRWLLWLSCQLGTRSPRNAAGLATRSDEGAACSPKPELGNYINTAGHFSRAVQQALPK